MPTSIGYQDLAALIARQPAVTERWREHVRNSTFGTIHAAIFSFPRPIGSSIPDPYFTQLAALDPRALDVTGSVPLPAPIELQFAAPIYDFPVVERRLKGDRLIVKKVPQLPAAPANQPAGKPPKLKDQASLIPGPKPAARPADPEPSVEAQPAPVAQKSDRSPLKAEMPVATAAGDGALGRAADAAEQIGNGSRAAGSVPRQDRRDRGKACAGRAAASAAGSDPQGRKAEAGRNAVAGCRIAARRQFGGEGRAIDANGTGGRFRSETAGCGRRESRTGSAGDAAPATEIADLESQRADVHGPLVLAAGSGRRSSPLASPRRSRRCPRSRRMKPSEPPLPEKQVDRFEVVDSLAQYSAPGPPDHAPLFRHP